MFFNSNGGGDSITVVKWLNISFPLSGIWVSKVMNHRMNWLNTRQFGHALYDSIAYTLYILSEVGVKNLWLIKNNKCGIIYDQQKYIVIDLKRYYFFKETLHSICSCII
jgi:hypothetical protein